MKPTKELIKDLNEWKEGKYHYCSDELTEEENCHTKDEIFGDMLCKDCYKGFRIREVHLEGRLEILQEHLIDYCSEEEYLSWIIGFLGTDKNTKQAFDLTRERLENTTRKRKQINKDIKEIKEALALNIETQNGTR